MPRFSMTCECDAAVEEVWKLLHDPTRYPEWWLGVATVEVTRAPTPTGTRVAAGDAGDAAGEFVMWPEGYPDYPMRQEIRSGPDQVTISCLVSDLVFTWQLRERGDATTVDVTVELPDREGHRLDTQRQVVEESLHALARLAAS